MEIIPHGRNVLATLFTGMGVEVGVERAVFSKIICQKSSGVNLYGVDPLEPYGDYRQHVSKERMDEFYKEVLEKMKPYNYVHIRKYSLDAVHEFPDESLDFVYIDANHSYESAKADIEAWAKKVKPGGIVSGHDYVDRKDFGVKQAVNEYVETHDKKLTIWSGDKSPSWMFLK